MPDNQDEDRDRATERRVGKWARDFEIVLAVWLLASTVLWPHPRPRMVSNVIVALLLLTSSTLARVVTPKMRYLNVPLAPRRASRLAG